MNETIIKQEDLKQLKKSAHTIKRNKLLKKKVTSDSDWKLSENQLKALRKYDKSIKKNNRIIYKIIEGL